eukprot:1323811-Prorocentrum_lima.AAC.1
MCIRDSICTRRRNWGGPRHVKGSGGFTHQPVQHAICVWVPVYNVLRSSVNSQAGEGHKRNMLYLVFALHLAAIVLLVFNTNQHNPT